MSDQDDGTERPATGSDERDTSLLRRIGIGIRAAISFLRRSFRHPNAGASDQATEASGRIENIPVVGTGRWAAICLLYLFGISSLSYILYKYCFGAQICDDCFYEDHVLVTVFVVSVYSHFSLWHDRRVHVARLADPSEVAAIVSDAEFVAHIANDTRESPASSNAGDSDSPNEVDPRIQSRIVDEISLLVGIGRRRWTEYAILKLDQLRLIPLGRSALVGRAWSTIEVLRDYADDDSLPFPKDRFVLIEEKFRNLIQDTEREGAKNNDDGAAIKKLRDELSELLETVASLDKDWATGKVVVNSLIACSAVSFVAFFFMGIIPILHTDFTAILADGWNPDLSSPLEIENFAFVAASGALLAVLNNMRREDVLDVGLDEGRRITIRAAIGVVMGLVAGALAYALAGTGLLGGRLVPDVLFVVSKSSDPVGDYVAMIYTGVLYAFIAGFAFDRFYERIRGMG